jgi:signal transduction histidine kinase
VDIALKQQPTSIQVQIADQGVGIPEDEHKHLFDLFFRARNATNIQGTGLGLPIAKKYIDLMQGDIAVVSQVEQGTTFTVTLPREQAHSEPV